MQPRVVEFSDPSNKQHGKDTTQTHTIVHSTCNTCLTWLTAARGCDLATGHQGIAIAAPNRRIDSQLPPPPPPPPPLATSRPLRFAADAKNAFAAESGMAGLVRLAVCVAACCCGVCPGGLDSGAARLASSSRWWAAMRLFKISRPICSLWSRAS